MISNWCALSSGNLVPSGMVSLISTSAPHLTGIFVTRRQPVALISSVLVRSTNGCPVRSTPDSSTGKLRNSRFAFRRSKDGPLAASVISFRGCVTSDDPLAGLEAGSIPNRYQLCPINQMTYRRCQGRSVPNKVVCSDLKLGTHLAETGKRHLIYKAVVPASFFSDRLRNR